MKIKEDIRGICLAWILFVLIGLGAMAKKSTDNNSFATPDFAFPKSVEQNARPMLKAALGRNDGVEALRAAMQIVIAENLVSADNAQRGVELFDSLSRNLSAPYSSLALLLETRLYGDIYREKSYLYNQRVIPVSPRPDEIAEWSGKMFTVVVDSLTEEAMKGAEKYKDVSLKGFAPIITDAEKADRAGFSLFDFMTLQSVANLKVVNRDEKKTIPFNVAASEFHSKKDDSLAGRIWKSNMDIHSSGHPTEAGAYMEYKFLKSENAGVFANGVSSQEDRRERWKAAIEKYRDTPYCGLFLSEYSSLYSPKDKEKYRDLYLLISSYLSSFPECKDAKSLKAILKNMEAKEVSLTIPSQILPESSFKAEITSDNLSHFYLLAVRLKDNRSGRCSKEDLKSGTVKRVVEVNLPQEEIPFRTAGTFEIPGLESGTYALVASASRDLNGLIINNSDRKNFSTFLVSRLRGIQMSGTDDKSGLTYFVVDGRNQSPVTGATVSLLSDSYPGKGKVTTLITDAAGSVNIPKGRYEVTVRKGTDFLYDYLYGYGNGGNKKEKPITSGSLFSDLSIYHPGDTVRFTGVVYSKNDMELSTCPEKDVTVYLMDANYQQIDSVNLNSDRFGRIAGSFVLPKNGLLGNWSILMKTKEESNSAELPGKNKAITVLNSFLTSRSFQLADYKTPTFFIETSGIDGDVKPGDMLVINGSVRTYSGMPVARAAVKYDISFSPWRWFGALQGADTYGGEVITDDSGKFRIELSTEGLKDTPYSIGRYMMKITATDAAGETQSAPAISFMMGKSYSIRADIPELIDADSKEKIGNIGVYDMLDHPVKTKVYYSLVALNDASSISSGEFESGAFPLDIHTLASGKYKLTLSLDPIEKRTDENEGDTADSANEENVTTEFIIWRKSDKIPPVQTSLWTPEREIIVKEGIEKGGIVKVPVGTSYPDSYILCGISTTDGSVKYQWFKISEGIISIPVEAPGEMERVKVMLTGMHDFQSQSSTIRLIPATQLQQLEITSDIFRDRVSPDAQEEWKFNFTLNGKRMADIPVMAVLSNKALNALAPFNWHFNPYNDDLYWNEPGMIRSENIGNIQNDFRTSSYHPVGSYVIAYPEWNLYGYSLYSPNRNGQIRIRGTRAAGAVKYNLASAPLYAKAKTEETAVEESGIVNEMFDAAMVESKATAGADKGGEDEPLRSVETSLAFFMSDLTTDKEGVATLSFRLPAANATWQLQLLGYTPDMRGSVLTRDIVAARSVMVSMNPPRFVRTGDKMQVSATIFNNSGEDASIGGEFIIDNPLTGEILAKETASAEMVKSMGSRIITVEYLVPSDLSALRIRVYGIGERSRDGEQTIIPVLPSSQPVIEGNTFYAAPGEEDIIVKLHDKGKAETVTLQYVDNPIWECVTALPSLSQKDSRSSLSLADDLFSNATAAGLIKRYPEIREALDLFASEENRSDSTLVSNLQKNEQLKVVTLNNTPWVNNAQGETMRMMNLVNYTDSSRVASAITETIEALGKLQNKDGGWSWCENMEPSEWITRSIIRRFAMMKRSGYLPSEAEEMIRRGMRYVDTEIVKEWRKIGAKNFSYLSLLDYFYDCDAFVNISHSREMQEIKRKMISAGENGWKGMDLYDKATFASILYKDGKRKEAESILNSISEFASSSKDKGIWFDNLSGGFKGLGKLRVTAHILQTMQSIRPASGDIDGMRQWLLLSKQTENWGDGVTAAEVVNAILTTGANWTTPSSLPEVYLNGEKLELPRIAAKTGAFTLSLTGKRGEVKIHRNASGPAWGGVVSQYVAPIREVKKEGNAQLSISKALYTVTADEDGSRAITGSLAQGDKVRVTLTLKTDRDLQYVVVKDNRSALLEPAEQVSDYTSTGGVWYYKEVRNEATNLFIPYLPKGTHIITYDCYVDRAGSYSLGIATAQSLYAPSITAHSSGELVKTD